MIRTSVALGFLAAMLWALVAAAVAEAHDATPTPKMPMGWKYPFSCCADYDCRDVPADWIAEKAGGYQIVITGEVVGYTDKRVKQSPDGRFHWCSKAGSLVGETICLFVPPSGS
ncbi:hypothetical protein [Mesorhizobium sp. M0058]|uniref:hypothetical protein n=1 Tax=Mesorhizobium sp. M0058 TaxID=2956865 RepID=UPI0033385A0A